MDTIIVVFEYIDRGCLEYHFPAETTIMGLCCNLANLQSQLGAAPVTTLGIPFDGIIRAHANPLR